MEEEKRKASIKKYNQSDKGKAVRKRYEQSRKGKEAKKRADKKYSSSDKRKKARKIIAKKYNQSDKRKKYMQEYWKKYSQLDEVKAHRKRYRLSEQGKISEKRSARKCRYHITEDEYNQLFKFQEGTCAICREPETRVTNGKITDLAVDHNHITGRIRGLLCHKCNISLSFFKEDINILERAIHYLMSYSDPMQEA